MSLHVYTQDVVMIRDHGMLVVVLEIHGNTKYTHHIRSPVRFLGFSTMIQTREFPWCCHACTTIPFIQTLSFQTIKCYTPDCFVRCVRQSYMSMYFSIHKSNGYSDRPMHSVWNANLTKGSMDIRSDRPHVLPLA